MVISGLVSLFDQLQPRRHGAAFEVKLRRQFKPCDVFEDIENACLGNDPGRDLLVAVLLALGYEIKWRDGDPKALIIHRLQPLVDVLHVSEFSHGTRISDRDSLTQIFPPNQGRAPCPASMTM